MSGDTAPTNCTHVASPVSIVLSEHYDFVNFLKQFTKKNTEIAIQLNFTVYLCILCLKARNATVVADLCAPKTHPLLLYVCSYRDMNLELCEIIHRRIPRTKCNKQNRSA